MPNNNSICYEGIQRLYRNAVVRLIRVSFLEAFPEDYSEKLQAPFTKEEWETIKKNALASRVSGELTTPLLDDFDLLSVSHFFNIFDKYYVQLVKAEAPSDPRENKRQKEKLLSWIKTIKDLRDPLMHPGEEDFTREDSFLLLDCARRVLLKLKLPESAGEIRSLMDALLGVHSIHSKSEPLEDELPPSESIVIDFVGRAKELEELWEWFEDPVSRRWALAGDGGKGKSALAYNFAFEVKLKAPPPFQTVLWLSAKRRRFLEGSISGAGEPDFFDLDSALSRLLTYYGWVEEISNPTESKRKRVLELLNEFPALTIVDDVDSLESENENVIEFFSLQVTETRSKVLFTSRRVPFGMGGTKTRVVGFNDEDAEKFILSRCQLLDLDPAVFDKETIQSIAQVTEGSPLYIEDLMRLTAVVRSAKEAIEKWKTKVGNEARKYALGRECELLGPEARQVLLAACVAVGPISFAEIEGVLGLSAERITAALNEL